MKTAPAGAVFLWVRPDAGEYIVNRRYGVLNKQEKNMKLIFGLLWLAFALAGCAEITPMVSPIENPDSTSAYLYGNFAMRIPGAIGLGLQIEEIHKGEKHLVKFRKDKRLTLIRVPAGKYVINRYHLLSFGNQITGTRDLLDEPFNVEFEVTAGRAYYLGDHEFKDQRVDMRLSGGGASDLKMDFSPPRDSYLLATQTFRRDYPALNDVPTARAFKQSARMAPSPPAQ
jgi:hypothetical protein